MRRLFLKLVRRRRLERDLAEEMAFHREMAAAGGNTLPFGNRAVIAEQARDLWRFSSVENLWRDVIYGIRGLVRQPALLASAVLSLALGIGANATIFSLGMELLLSEPSVTDARSLVYVRDRGNSHSEPDKLDALLESGLFADVAGQGGRLSRAGAHADRSDNLCAGLCGDADDRGSRDLDSRAPCRRNRSDDVVARGVA